MTVLLGLAERLYSAHLSVVMTPGTDRKANSEYLIACFEGGAHMIEILTGGLDATAAKELLDDARAIARHYMEGLVVVRDDVALAKEYKADVLHLGATGATTIEARAALSTWALVGRSVHDEESLDAALADPGLSYLSIGPVFGGTEQFRAPGLDLIRAAARKAPVLDGGLPWFATGGITLDNAPEVIEAGATRLRVGAAIAKDPQQQCAAFRSLLKPVWAGDAMQNAAFGPEPTNGLAGNTPTA